MSWSQPEDSSTTSQPTATTTTTIEQGEFPAPPWASRLEHLSEEPGRGGATTVESPFKEPSQLQPEHQTNRLSGYVSLGYRSGVSPGMGSYPAGSGGDQAGATGGAGSAGQASPNGIGFPDSEERGAGTGTATEIFPEEGEEVAAPATAASVASAEEVGREGQTQREIETDGQQPPESSTSRNEYSLSANIDAVPSASSNAIRLPSPTLAEEYPSEHYSESTLPSDAMVSDAHQQQQRQQQFELEAHLASIAHSLRVAEEQNNAAMGVQQEEAAAAAVAAEESTSTHPTQGDENRPQKMAKIKGKPVTTQKTRDAGIKRRNVEARFHCTVEGCGSSFTRSHNLSGHLRSHADERPFKCPVCQRGFARQHDCKRHARLHVPSQAQSFPCPNCDRKFARSDGLLQHQNICAFAQTQPAANLQAPSPPSPPTQPAFPPMDPGQPSYSNPEEGHMGENGFEARQSIDSGFDNGVLQGSSAEMGGMGLEMETSGDKEALESAVNEYIRCYPLFRSFRSHDQHDGSPSTLPDGSTDPNQRVYNSPFPAELTPPELLVWLSHSAYPSMAKDPSILRSLGKLMGLPSIADDHPALSTNTNGKRRFEQAMVDPELMRIEEIERTFKDFQAASGGNDHGAFEFDSNIGINEHGGPSESFVDPGPGGDELVESSSGSTPSVAAAGGSKSEITRCNYIQPITGERCMKTFARVFDMRRHVETIHHSSALDPNRPGYVCDGCEKKFSRSDALVRHRRDYCANRKLDQTAVESWGASPSSVDQQLPSGAQPNAEFESPFDGSVNQPEPTEGEDEVVVSEHVA